MKVNAKKIVVNSIKILIILIVLFPFFWLLISSFKHEKDIMSYPPKIFAAEYTLENYRKVMDYIPLLVYVKNTVIFSGGVVLAQLLLDSLAAYALARLEFKGKRVLSYIVLLTMMIPFQVYMIPLFIEENVMGILDTYAGLILPRMVMPFGIFLMRTAFVSLPKNLEEAARIDGMNEFGIFFKIMMPLCKPTLLTLGIITQMCIRDRDGTMEEIPAYVVKADGASKITLHIADMTEDEKKIVKAGCLINYNRNRNNA